MLKWMELPHPLLHGAPSENRCSTTYHHKPNIQPVEIPHDISIYVIYVSNFIYNDLTSWRHWNDGYRIGESSPND